MFDYGLRYGDGLFVAISDDECLRFAIEQWMENGDIFPIVEYDNTWQNPTQRDRMFIGTLEEKLTPDKEAGCVDFLTKMQEEHQEPDENEDIQTDISHGLLPFRDDA